MPILGIIASSFATGGDYESIATYVVGAGGATDITFSSIPATFKHLQIRCIARNTVGNSTVGLRFNSDSGANYATHRLVGTGATVNANAATSAVSADGGTFVISANANTFGVVIFDVLDYAGTNKNKTVKHLGGWDANGSGQIGLLSSLWLNTSAITNIVLLCDANNFAQHSHFALYGIKG